MSLSWHDLFGFMVSQDVVLLQTMVVCSLSSDGLQQTFWTATQARTAYQYLPKNRLNNWHLLCKSQLRTSMGEEKCRGSLSKSSDPQSITKKSGIACSSKMWPILCHFRRSGRRAHEPVQDEVHPSAHLLLESKSGSIYIYPNCIDI